MAIELTRFRLAYLFSFSLWMTSVLLQLYVNISFVYFIFFFSLVSLYSRLFYFCWNVFVFVAGNTPNQNKTKSHIVSQLMVRWGPKSTISFGKFSLSLWQKLHVLSVRYSSYIEYNIIKWIDRDLFFPQPIYKECAALKCERLYAIRSEMHAAYITKLV